MLFRSATPAQATVVDGTQVAVAVIVSPGADGTVALSEDTGNAARAAGSVPVAVVDGSAQLTVTPTGVGTHTYRVVFTPADPTSFVESSTTFSIAATPKPTDPGHGGGNTGGGNTGGGNTGGGDQGAGAPGGAGASPSASPAPSAGADRLGATGGDVQGVAIAGLGALALMLLGAGLLHRRRQRTEDSARSTR